MAIKVQFYLCVCVGGGGGGGGGGGQSLIGPSQNKNNQALDIPK